MNTRTIKYTPSDLLALIKYSAGLYSRLTGIPCFVIVDQRHLQPGDQLFLEENHLVRPVEPDTKIIFEPPRREIQKQFEQEALQRLHRFIEDKCVIDPSYRVLASQLHGEFEEEIEEPITPNRLFPRLMKQIMKSNRWMTKRIVGGKTMYCGLQLRSTPMIDVELVTMPMIPHEIP